MADEKDQPIDDAQILELGIALGQRRAFGMIAGRCSAAQAECLRKIRDQKAYLKFAPNWEEYCSRHLKMPKRTVDYNIALLKKHGPLYFEAAALTGISPAEFERIKGAFQPDGIHIGSEVIALIPENSERVVDAVARLQAEADAAQSARPADSVEAQLGELEKRVRKLCAGFHETARAANLIERDWVMAAIKRARGMIDQLELEIR